MCRLSEWMGLKRCDIIYIHPQIKTILPQDSKCQTSILTSIWVFYCHMSQNERKEFLLAALGSILTFGSYLWRKLFPLFSNLKISLFQAPGMMLRIFPVGSSWDVAGRLQSGTAAHAVPTVICVICSHDCRFNIAKVKVAVWRCDMKGQFATSIIDEEVILVPPQDAPNIRLKRWLLINSDILGSFQFEFPIHGPGFKCFLIHDNIMYILQALKGKLVTQNA